MLMAKSYLHGEQLIRNLIEEEEIRQKVLQGVSVISSVNISFQKKIIQDLSEDH